MCILRLKKGKYQHSLSTVISNSPKNICLLSGLASTLLAMASNPEVMASTLLAMASNLRAMASTLLAMASNLRAMASTLVAMPSPSNHLQEAGEAPESGRVSSPFAQPWQFHDASHGLRRKRYATPRAAELKSARSTQLTRCDVGTAIPLCPLTMTVETWAN